MSTNDFPTDKGTDPNEGRVSETFPGSKSDKGNTDYETVRDHLESESATSQLAAMLEDGPTAVAEPEEAIEHLSDRKDAPIDWAIVVPLVAIVAAVVIWGLTAQESFSNFANTSFSFVMENFGWAFVLFGTIFVVFVLIIAMSRFGSIRLGAIDEEPEFRTSSWIAMMFAAGMGIGLMFYGASEPLAFYRDGVPGHKPNEVGTAMAQSMFHWTLHPWAVYAIIGLAIAYSSYRLGRKQLLSSAFIPLIGQRRAEGWLGKVIDGLAVFATIFGTACSLGLGSLQITAGLQAAGWIEESSNTLIIGIVSVLTLAFLLSAMSGVGKGIQYLSNFNMVIAALLAIFVFVVGPTVNLLNMLPTSLGSYVALFAEMASRTAASADGSAGEWLGGWTIFYWAWWISWSPFVGMFLARISRGRSIREFCLGILLVPAGLSTVWFAIFGGTAIWMEQGGQSIYGDGTSEAQLFNLLYNLPLGEIVAIFAIILLGTFFVTSADSASTVMGSMTQDGVANAKPWLSALWGLGTALVGMTLLIAGGDDALNALQSVTIVAASPFLVILILLMFAIVKDLRNDVIYLDQREQQQFNRKLAIERRLHREKAYRELQKERRRQALSKRK
ncbi:BCCT family transporter [Corynebacterium cystitidis]|uniref:Choline/carnitine/betaine transport n=1 Tax=Corynebacterium cystitidis DSM 20524 TaxID=1121357 RepID=A0A1H9TUQ8_9CORY|nr:Glycine betaine transporter BetP [Corynebacterium cystitidis DSM 20524]SES00667.1 choline/carnitine/betaine transport [Corynebacterium cystitidis DSM 20524]SNV81689.1 Choline-glycine betaine transporter [Corynebacterium cystitidis]